MKKFSISTYSFLALFVLINTFTSCDEQSNRNKRYESSKRYFKKYVVYDNIDSLRTDLTIYDGVIDGHKYRYHIFNGKNKSQMELEHMVDECKACKKYQ